MKELNKHKLDEALGKLSVHDPDDTIWDRIGNRLSGEEIAGQLKGFNPPDEIWSNISRELAKEEKLKRLKNYTPGEETWKLIVQHLDHEERKPGIRRWLTYTGWAAAAVVILLLGYFLIIRPAGSTGLQYSSVTIQETSMENWSDSGDEIFSALNRVCAARPVACSGEDFLRKKKELEYLVAQQELIRQRMSPYRDNKELQLMLTKIELEKSTIVKEMISGIL